MSNEGWTWVDLAEELWARGINPHRVDIETIMHVIHLPTVEQAADRIEEEGSDA